MSAGHEIGSPIRENRTLLPAPLPPDEARGTLAAAAGVSPVGLRPPFDTPAAAFSSCSSRRSHLDCRAAPDGVKRIDCPTRWIEIQPRVHVKNAADLAAARDVLNAITIQGLAQYLGGLAPPATAYQYATPKIDPKVASSHMRFVDPLQFWEIFSTAMNENPPPVNEIESVLPQFAYLGIERSEER